MKITERQEEILNKIVQDYIDLAYPISSEFLEKKHNFGICPATIRIEMQKLTDGGFIFQPHTSAGRVPTDKGYRFFVDTLLKREIPEFEDVFEIEDIFQGVRKDYNPPTTRQGKDYNLPTTRQGKDIFKLASRLTKFLAKESSSFTILNLLERDFLLKEGWEEILLEPEFGEKDLISDFVEFIESFEKHIENLKINPVRNRRFLNGVNSGIKIYIGKENPFSKTKNFSIISSKCYFPDDEEGVISLLGPIRMAYDKNISLINSLVRALENF